jgi:hypothetical protein
LGPKLLGWTGQFVFLSWDKTGVDTVYYDPVMAMSTDTSGMILACYPTLFLSFLSVLVVHYFFTNNHYGQ